MSSNSKEKESQNLPSTIFLLKLKKNSYWRMHIRLQNRRWIDLNKWKQKCYHHLAFGYHSPTGSAEYKTHTNIYDSTTFTVHTYKTIKKSCPEI